MKYYSLTNILSHNADYNIIYGERSNGKTTSVLDYALQDYVNSGYRNQLGLFRRWEEDFKGSKGQQIFKGIENLDWISRYTKGKYNAVKYYAQRWYLAFLNYSGEYVSVDTKPFCLGFALSSEEHYKMNAFPDVKTILFDEFITRQYYLPEEFVKFQNLLSTIIRLRDDVKIFMCGNTINKYCPYFSEMGLVGVRKQKKGTIDVYTYGESELKVAVEYSDFPSKKKASNKYFAFNNPKLEMITNGGWEIDIYPHLPHKFKPSDVMYYFYILFDGEMLQGNIIDGEQGCFMFLHRKTTPIREDNEQIVYQQQADHRYNYRNNILKPYGKIDKYIKDLIGRKKVFYQDNEVGEIMNNYLMWCRQN